MDDSMRPICHYSSSCCYYSSSCHSYSYFYSFFYYCYYCYYYSSSYYYYYFYFYFYYFYFYFFFFLFFFYFFFFVLYYWLLLPLKLLSSSSSFCSCSCCRCLVVRGSLNSLELEAPISLENRKPNHRCFMIQHTAVASWAQIDLKSTPQMGAKFLKVKTLCDKIVRTSATPHPPLPGKIDPHHVILMFCHGTLHNSIFNSRTCHYQRDCSILAAPKSF